MLPKPYPALLQPEGSAAAPVDEPTEQQSTAAGKPPYDGHGVTAQLFISTTPR